MAHLTQLLNKEESERRHKAMAAQSFEHKFNVYLFIRTRDQQQEQIDAEDFLNYELTDADIAAFTRRYWQKPKSEKLGSLSIQEIEQQMQEFMQKKGATIRGMLVRYVTEVYEHLFPTRQAEQLFKAEQCHFCSLSLPEIEQLYEKEKLQKKNGRGWRLEISLRDPNKEYSAENCVMACYWCNTAKGDEFSEEEFKTIASAIRKGLLDRLKG